MVDAGDDYYDGYEDYEPKTVDPGPWMLVGLACYSLLCLLLVPPLVILGNRREKRRMERKKWEQIKQVATSINSDSDGSNDGHENEIETELVSDDVKRPVAEQRLKDNVEYIGMNNGMDEAVKVHYDNPYQDQRHTTKSKLSAISSAMSQQSSTMAGHRRKNRRHPRNFPNLYERARATEDHHGYISGRSEYEHSQVGYERSRVGSALNDEESALPMIVDDLRPEDAADAHDQGLPQASISVDEEQETTICCGPNALCSKRTVRSSYHALIDIANPERETKRILQIGWPLTMSSLISSVFDAINVAIVSQYLGTNALTAWVVTHLLIGLTDTFLGGPSDALNTVCAHAVGTGNYRLAGQYVQIAAVLYGILAIPCLGIWFFYIDRVILLMGLSPQIAKLSASYTQVTVLTYFLSGLFEGYNSLLDVTGNVGIGAIFDLVYGLVNTLTFWALCYFFEDFNLFWLGVTEVVLSVIFFLAFTGVVLWRGYLTRFLGGMLGSFGLRNTQAVKNVYFTAIPLSFGSLLEYGEWEALTFFVAFMGPAEVAAWGILESIWAVFEAATSGVSSAASIRLAYHLGNGNINMAKMSSSKSIFLSTCLSVFITAIIFIVGDDLPGFFTEDSTLQGMVLSVIPMIGLGNVLMIIGMVSWTLIGAQGRYRLATTVSAVMTFMVSLPLSALFTFYFHYNLKGIVAAVVMGYSTTGLVLGYLLQRSDWENISRNIQEYNAVSDSDDDDDDDDDSSSSGSIEDSDSESDA